MYRESGHGDRERRSFAPVRVGDELNVTIEAVGEKGDGVAKVQGFVLFVPGAQKDETVRVRVTKVFKKMGFAEIVGKGETQSGESENSEGSSEEESYNENGTEEELSE